MATGTKQYSKPIGPSQPIGRDTSGGYVFDSGGISKGSNSQKASTWSSGSGKSYSDYSKAKGQTGRSGGGGSSSRSSSSGGVSSIASSNAQAKAEQEKKEQQTRQQLTDLSRQYAKDIRNIQGVQGKSERLNKYLEQRQNIISGKKDIVSGGKDTTSKITRDIKTGEVKRTEEIVKGIDGGKVVIKTDYTKEGTPVRIDTYKAGGIRTGGAYVKEEVLTKEIEPIKQKENIENVYLGKSEMIGTGKVSIFGIKEKKRYEKELKEYQDLIKEYKVDKKTGEIIVPKEDYFKVQKEYKDVLEAKELYKSTPAQKVKSFFSPFGADSDSKYVSVGGRLIPRGEYEKLSPQVIKISSILQPENILLMSSLPQIKETKVIFSGVKTGTKKGIQTTAIDFKTSLGTRGQAIGVSKGSKSGKIYAGETSVIGYQGRRVIDLTRANPKFIMKDIEGFSAVEQSIGLTKGKQSIEISGGYAKSLSENIPSKFRAVSFGEKQGKVTKILGASESKSGVSYYLGKIKEIKPIESSKLKITGRSITPIESSSTQVQATKSAISSAVGGTKVVPATKSFQQIVSPSTQILQSKQKTDLKEIAKQEVSPITKQVIIPKQQQVESTKQINILKSATKVKPQQKVKEVVKEIEKPLQIEMVKPATKIKPILKQISKTSQDLKEISLLKTNINFPKEIKTLKPVPSLKQKTITSKSIVESLAKGDDDFKIFVTKERKDIELKSKEKIKSLKEAKQTLKGELLESLRAGGYITKGGEKIKIDLGQGFRTSKIDPFKVVQLKEKRLGRKSEVQEIQFFKKTKGGKNKFL